jgi:hypothetical protein
MLFCTVLSRAPLALRSGLCWEGFQLSTRTRVRCGWDCVGLECFVLVHRRSSTSYMDRATSKLISCSL